ncbi:hypothetical protein HYS97_01385 [Candidatus Daviesbacteria bacterium]|nr:hypothetical protein [Candidatus Daviesbacteria bacterium]
MVDRQKPKERSEAEKRAWRRELEERLVRHGWLSEKEAFGVFHKRRAKSLSQGGKRRFESEEERRKLSDAGKARFATEEAHKTASLAKGGTAVLTYPLFLRMGTIAEVMELTQLDRVAVEGAKNRFRRRGLLAKPTPEETATLKSRAQSEQYEVKAKDSQQGIILASRLLRAGLIPDDKSYWNQLERVYQEHGRRLPTTFAERLILETYLIAFSDIQKGQEIFKLMEQLGESDPSQKPAVLVDDVVFLRSYCAGH